MLLKDLTQVWVSQYDVANDHGEKTKTWRFKRLNNSKGTAFLNIQQDVNELDRKSTGEIDYSIYKARTNTDYNIQKGDGISFEDISKSSDIKPEYRILDRTKIGSTYVYRMEKIQ